jgi:arylsulfatase A-like enzyme
MQRSSVISRMTRKFWAGLSVAILGGSLWCGGAPAHAQNDWQFPDPYFGAFQHRQAGTPEAERRYRAEIAPQHAPRLHDYRPPAHRAKPRWNRQRFRGRSPSA